MIRFHFKIKTIIAEFSDSGEQGRRVQLRPAGRHPGQQRSLRDGEQSEETAEVHQPL